MQLTQKIKSIDLVSVVEREGTQLRQRGKYFIGLCPLHPEKTPSFVVDANKNKFTCYGCHEYGDPVDFVQKLHGFTFRDALSYLGIENKPLSREQRKELHKQIKQADRRRKLKEAMRQRERELAYIIGTLIRWTYKATEALTPENLYLCGGIYFNLPWYEWCHDTLVNGSKLDKAYVLWSFKGFPIIERGRLFRKDFDFSKWLRSILKENGTPDENRTGKIELSFG